MSAATDTDRVISPVTSRMTRGCDELLPDDSLDDELLPDEPDDRLIRVLLLLVELDEETLIAVLDDDPLENETAVLDELLVDKLTAVEELERLIAVELDERLAAVLLDEELLRLTRVLLLDDKLTAVLLDEELDRLTRVELLDRLTAVELLDTLTLVLLDELLLLDVLAIHPGLFTRFITPPAAPLAVLPPLVPVPSVSRQYATVFASVPRISEGVKPLDEYRLLLLTRTSFICPGNGSLSETRPVPIVRVELVLVGNGVSPVYPAPCPSRNVYVVSVECL